MTTATQARPSILTSKSFTATHAGLVVVQSRLCKLGRTCHVTKRSESQSRYLENASRVYAGQLATSHGKFRATAVAYLGEHGVTGEMALKYRLGLVADPLPGDERYKGGLAIPYLSQKGVTALKYRMFGGGQKMAQPKGQEARPYNTVAYFAAGNTIGLAEGEIDALVATELLGLPTLGIPGADSFKDDWRDLLKDYTEVIVFADGDPRSSEAYMKPVELTERIGWRARMIRCPQGEDVSSLAAKGQLDIVRQQIRTSNDDPR